jgi:hypothetical protein
MREKLDGDLTLDALLKWKKAAEAVAIKPMMIDGKEYYVVLGHAAPPKRKRRK